MPLLPLLIYSFYVCSHFKPDSLSGFFLTIFRIQQPEVNRPHPNYALSRQRRCSLSTLDLRLADY